MMASIWSADERHVRDYCEELARCHERHSGLRVEAYTITGRDLIPGDRKHELWSIFQATQREEAAKRIKELLGEDWQDDDDDPWVVYGDYLYRFSDDTAGFRTYMELEKALPISVGPLADRVLGASGVFLAGSIALRNQIPLLQAELGHDYLPKESDGVRDFVQRCGLSPANVLPMVFFRVSLLHDPFLSLKLAIKWLLDPTTSSHASDAWKSVLGRLPYSDIVEQAANRTKQNAGDLALSTRQYNILEAMLVLDATTASQRCTTAEIAEAAEATVNADYFKQSVADLKKHGLIDTKPSRGGGCWLTPEGLKLARHLGGKR